MKAPSYKYYGKRGITVSEDWISYQKFKEDMGQPPAGYSLDRVNNKQGYSKENCRWAPPSVQNSNRRTIESENEENAQLAEMMGAPDIALAIRRRLDIHLEAI